MQTCQLAFSDEVNYKVIFYLLPIKQRNRVLLAQGYPYSQLYQENDQGTVISIGDEKGNYRGAPRSKSIKNCITLDICGQHRNISIKLYNNRIHFSGVTSIHMAMATGIEFMKTIFKAQNHLNWFQQHLQEGQEIIDWISKDVAQYLEYDLKDFPVEETLAIVPQHFKLEFATYIIEMIPDYTKEMFLTFMKMYPTIKEIIKPWCIPEKVVNINVNHNFNLGCAISRSRMALTFNKMPPYKVSYLNDTNIGVTIELPYEIPPHLQERITRSSGTHSFTVYSTGAVTHSGPDQLLNEIAYNKFIADFESVREIVKSRNPARKTIAFKFVPQQYLQEWTARLEEKYRRNHEDIYALEVLHNSDLHSLQVSPPASTEKQLLEVDMTDPVEVVAGT